MVDSGLNVHFAAALTPFSTVFIHFLHNLDFLQFLLLLVMLCSFFCSFANFAWIKISICCAPKGLFFTSCLMWQRIVMAHLSRLRTKVNTEIIASRYMYFIYVSEWFWQCETSRILLLRMIFPNCAISDSVS
jgi:hypothetical protein